MSGLSSILSGTGHAVFEHRSAATSASAELAKLFSKLHMDAIPSFSTDTSSTASGSAAATASTSSRDALTSIASGLRHLLDGTASAVKDVRSATRAASAYARQGGLAGAATATLSKLA